MTGHEYISGTTPVRGPMVGLGVDKNGMGEKKELTTADVIYRIATVTAVISLLASVL